MKIFRKVLVTFLVIILTLSGTSIPTFVQAKTATKAVSSLKLSKTKVTLTVGKTYKLKATIKPSNATNKKLTYTSNNKKVATITSAGKIKAISTGTAVIKVKTSNGITKRCKVTVKAKSTDSSSNTSNSNENTDKKGDSLSDDSDTSEDDDSDTSEDDENEIYGIYLDDYECQMLINTSQTISVDVLPDEADKSNLIYQSSDETVATISSTGVITALQAGTTTILIARKDKTSVNESFELTVIGNPSLSVNSATITIGDSSDTVIESLGTPDRMDQSYYGDTAYVYNSDYSYFTMVYMQANQVVGFYSDALDFECQGIGYNASISSDQAQNYNNCYDLYYYVDYIGTGLVNGVKLISSSAAINNLAYCLSSMELQAFDLTNSVRARNGISQLTWDDTAADCARLHSEDMATNDYFSHTDLDGLSSSQRMTQAGISWRGCGENIAAGYGDATSTVNGWYQSEGHRRNMLNSSYIYLGVGAAVGGSYGNYYTQNFYY